jgi:response regulator RpfG family c-di-GMP phosphodiesterase
LNGSIRVLTEILSVVDPNLFGHAMKLRELVQTLARALNIPSSWDIESAAMLSQIGYVGIPPEVLVKARKRNPMADNEKEMLSRFPETGRQLLANIPRLESVSRIVLYQNKLFNGSGFPGDGVAGDKIPLGSRILKPLSDLLQLENEGVARGQAFQLLLGRQGWYDPEVLKKLSQCLVDETQRGVAAGETLASLCLKELRSGYRLVSKIETLDGTLLLSPGQRLSPAHLERLRNYAELVGIKEPIQVLIADADRA